MKAVYDNYSATATLVSEDEGHYIPSGRLTDSVKWLYNTLGYNSDDFEASVSDYLDHGTWSRFNQGEFVGVDSELAGGEAWSWGDTEFHNSGAYYIPYDCESTQCKVHLSFHGCEGTGADFSYENEDLMNFAASNQLIVIWPSSYCWEWYGLIDPDNTRSEIGLYEKAVQAMICRITSDEATNTCPMGASSGLITSALGLIAMAYALFN